MSTPYKPELLTLQFLVPQTGWIVGPEAHGDFYELVYVLKGDYATDFRGQKHFAVPGDIFIYHPREIHYPTYALDKSVEICTVWFKDQSCQPGGPPPDQQLPAKTHDQGGRILVLLRWMQELFYQDLDRKADIDAVMQLLLSEIKHTQIKNDNEFINQIRDYIRSNITENIRLEDLAEVAQLSKFHFSRVFKESTGMPPMQFVQDIRVDSARNLLANTTLPLKSVAEEVGISNEFYLSRIFKKVTGQSPSDYRKSAHRLNRTHIKSKNFTKSQE